MSQLKEKKFNNIINWIVTMDDSHLFEIMNKTDQLKHINKNIDFFLKYKFQQVNDIPDYIIQEQNDIKSKINKSKSKVINFMAPTSFGKSTILLDIISENSMNKMIVCPTLALCNEYYIKIQKRKIEKNVYIFTPEKANIFLALNDDIKFDKVIFDEFYEATSPDRRGSFIACLKKLNTLSEKIILISPIGAKITKFINSLGIVSPNEIMEVNSNVSATSRIINLLEFETNKKYNHYKYFQEVSSQDINGFRINETLNTKNVKKYWKNEIIFNIFKEKKETMIYTSYENIIRFSKILIKKNNPGKYQEEGFFTKIILEYLEKNFPETLLYELIKRGYAYHHGKMDDFLRFMIEQAFEQKEIKWILCTRTLSKGVNLDPKYLVIENTARQKNENEANFSIDMTNMFGRTGRLTSKKFIGNLYLIVDKKSRKVEEFKKMISNNEKEEIYFEEIKNNIKRIDYKTTSLYFEHNKDKIPFNSNVSEEDLAILKLFILRKDGKIELNEVSKLEIFINNFFKIDWNKTFNDRKQYIFCFFNNFGFSNIYKNKLKINKKINNKYFETNDHLLKSIIEKYNTFIGYHFMKILMTFAEIMYKNNYLTNEEYFEALRGDKGNVKNDFPDAFKKALKEELITEDEACKIINKVMENNEK